MDRRYKRAGRKKRLGALCGAAVGLLVLLSLLAASSAQDSTEKSQPDNESMRTFNIAVVLSRDLGPYQQGVDGFKEALAKAEVKHALTEYELSSDAKEVDALCAKLVADRPDLILTLGSEASIAVAEKIRNVPIVFAIVANPEDLGLIGDPETETTSAGEGLAAEKNGGAGNRAVAGDPKARPQTNVAGVSTDVDPALQFGVFKEIFPRYQSIGVVYSPQHTAKTVARGAAAAREMGIKFFAESAEEKDLDKALKNLDARNIDCLWTTTDPGVFAPAAARRVLAFALRNRLPVIGFSKQMVKAGALFGFSIDYEDIGRQAAEAACEILRGTKTPQDVGLIYPRRCDLVINLNVARQIGVTVPDEVLKKAVTVYGEE